MITIMLVEDDRPLRILTRAHLKDKYNIVEAADGQEALDILAHRHVDILLVDIMMPHLDGYGFVEALRDAGDETPVIFLTAMDDFSHKKQGFALGIDDYLTKPIDYEELEWHLEAVMRRAGIRNAKCITLGDFELSEDRFTARWPGAEVQLTDKEFGLLHKLLSYPETLFTKQQLMDEIWGYDTESDYSTIKTYISRLRSKLEGCGAFELISVRGLGYKAHITEGAKES